MPPFSSHTKLASLTPSQRDQVAAWLLEENLTQQQTADRVEKVFGFPISQHAISVFWHRECVPRKLLRSAEAADSLQAVARLLKTDWQATNAQLMGQKIFETLSDPATDIKTVSALGMVLEKVRARALHEKTLAARLATEKRREQQRERQMAFAREKFEFDAADAVLKEAAKIKTISTDPALSSDEKREQLRRLLFPQAFAP